MMQDGLGSLNSLGGPPNLKINAILGGDVTQPCQRSKNVKYSLLQPLGLAEIAAQHIRGHGTSDCGKRGEYRCGLCDGIGRERRLTRGRFGQPEIGSDLRALLLCGLLVDVFSEARNLVVGAQPAHMATALFRDALAIERDKLFYNLFIAQGFQPAVSLKHKPVESFVQLLEDKNQTVNFGPLLIVTQ